MEVTVQLVGDSLRCRHHGYGCELVESWQVFPVIGTTFCGNNFTCSRCGRRDLKLRSTRPRETKGKMMDQKQPLGKMEKVQKGFRRVKALRGRQIFEVYDQEG